MKKTYLCYRIGAYVISDILKEPNGKSKFLNYLIHWMKNNNRKNLCLFKKQLTCLLRFEQVECIQIW